MSKTTKVRCKSGLMGIQYRLQDNYLSFSEFECYDEMWGLHQRLGFESVSAAWEANPLVRSSVDPSDYEIVSDV